VAAAVGSTDKLAAMVGGIVGGKSQMDAFRVRKDVLDDYKSFERGFLNIREPEVLAKESETGDVALL
jgi:hypothetical protein